jgi:hypothetical protein
MLLEASARSKIVMTPPGGSTCSFPPIIENSPSAITESLSSQGSDLSSQGSESNASVDSAAYPVVDSATHAGRLTNLSDFNIPQQHSPGADAAIPMERHVSTPPRRNAGSAARGKRARNQKFVTSYSPHILFLSASLRLLRLGR